VAKFTNAGNSFSNYKIVTLLKAALVLILFSVHQTGLAAVIYCPDNDTLCNGTAGDDIIFILL